MKRCKFKKKYIFIAILSAFLLLGCEKEKKEENHNTSSNTSPEIVVSPTDLGISDNNSVVVNDIRAYSGNTVVEINGNVPGIDKSDGKDEFESYSSLDSLGRVGVAYANISTATMPKDGEVRGEIGMIKPTGWKQNKYDCIEDRYLYNRAHLIAWSLGSENDNELNLMTGTRQLNLAMVPYENSVANYCRRTGNHVLYRVTPDFEGDDLLARGVEIEALSVEDDEISFHIYVFNVQDGVVIDYSDGTNMGDE